MSARATLVALLLLVAALAQAAPRPSIPASELPGRERERFIDPFPQPPRSEPLIVVPRQLKPKRNCGPRQSKRSRRKC